LAQVWFQNQRAKMKKMQRRAKTDKDGKQIDKDSAKEKDGEFLYKWTMTAEQGGRQADRKEQ
jgi:hypothetical protein